MSTEPTAEGVTLISGEPTRCYVHSDSKTNVQYLVDLGEFDGQGSCSCPDFTMRKRPHLEKGERDWEDGSLMCRHIRRAWLVLGPRLAKLIDQNP